MTATVERPRRAVMAAHADAPAEEVVRPLSAQVVPEQLLSGGEIVLLAIKPSPWFIVLNSGRWIAAVLAAWLLARIGHAAWLTLPLLQLVIGLMFLRLVWATLQWSTRLYVLTNRRVMLIRGVFNVDLFECALPRIQNTWATFTLAERLLRLGSIHMSTAAGVGGGVASWLTVARPLEVQTRLRDAIARANHRGCNGL